MDRAGERLSFDISQVVRADGAGDGDGDGDGVGAVRGWVAEEAGGLLPRARAFLEIAIQQFRDGTCLACFLPRRLRNCLKKGSVL